MKNDYEIRGNVTVIFLDRKDGARLECLIDTADLPRAMEFPGKWYGNWNNSVENYYIYGNFPSDGTGRKRIVLLHRWITMAGPKVQIDHINNNTLDNRKSCNLRLVTDGENKQNRKGAQKNNKTSGIRGVSLHKPTGKWVVQVCVNGNHRYCGLYSDLKEAAKVAEQTRAKLMPYSKDSPMTNIIEANIEIQKPIKRKIASSGVVGIYSHCGKWRVRPRINGKMVEIGVFRNLEDAKKALFRELKNLEAR
jgi:hypothetical protein